ncbi:guanine nucleotide exchange factor [Hypoxylon trugodes]|uniref:guanine nucleotide exchange factor n=1 Tax=Hypoxylon trugodes TaxID=326681 RepID=UPI00218FEF8A|nr:guanine nucleotide exchange factor [Hypoxylon trugodes]KAI1384314.1 guanine nucleotide exchange factor [Hypoxylon trugodes]
MTPQSPLARSGLLWRLFSSSRNRKAGSEELLIHPEMAQPNPQIAAAAALKGPAKLAAVTGLMEKLTQDLETVSLLPQQRDSALEELKIYGRDPRDADPIFAKEGVETLTRHAFNSPSSATSRNAMRVLCNTLFLKEQARQVFVNLGYEAKLCEKLKSDNRDDEFLASRLLFLTTYGTNMNLAELIDKHQLADSINKNLERHAKRYSAQNSSTDPMEVMALTETLKLLFNVGHYCSSRISSFTAAIPHIVTILCKGSFPALKPLDPPTGSLIHALLNLEIGSKDVQASLYPQSDPGILANRLIELLGRATKAYSEGELESTVTPLLGVISSIHEHAPTDVKYTIHTKLLPTEDDRAQVLGRSESLPSWLLKNSTNPLAPSLRETVSNLFFDMSDKDASKFVENVGYGFASGFLFNRNMPVPQNASEAFSTGGNRPVNPITGQFLDRERQPDAPPMTEEEREREAERLFILFERLRANGIISAENPVRTAVEQGRFEELPDDYQEDVD